MKYKYISTRSLLFTMFTIRHKFFFIFHVCFSFCDKQRKNLFYSFIQYLWRVKWLRKSADCFVEKQWNKIKKKKQKTKIKCVYFLLRFSSLSFVLPHFKYEKNIFYHLSVTQELILFSFCVFFVFIHFFSFVFFLEHHFHLLSCTKANSSICCSTYILLCTITIIYFHLFSTLTKNNKSLLNNWRILYSITGESLHDFMGCVSKKAKYMH